MFRLTLILAAAVCLAAPLSASAAPSERGLERGCGPEVSAAATSKTVHPPSLACNRKAPEPEFFNTGCDVVVDESPEFDVSCADARQGRLTVKGTGLENVVSFSLQNSAMGQGFEQSLPNDAVYEFLPAEYQCDSAECAVTSTSIDIDVQKIAQIYCANGGTARSFDTIVLYDSSFMPVVLRGFTVPFTCA